MLSPMSLTGLLLAGLCLGGLYFWGLWMTLRRLPRWPRPFLGMGLSVLIRLIVLLGLGGLFLRYPIAPPFETLLLLSAGVWISRNLLITTLIATTRSTNSQSASQHPQFSSLP